MKTIFKQNTENDDDIINYRKQLIPDAVAIQPLPGAAGFDSWINTLITKVHAASHGIDAAREWIAIVKRDPDIEKYQSAEKFEALDIKLASALKPVLTRKLQILVNQKERALELTNGKPLRGRQILCMIIDHYQINTNDKDYKNITDLNNVTLRGDDILGFITKWDDVLLRFDQTKLPTEDQLLLLLERQIVNSASFKIQYTLFQNEKQENPGSQKTTYDYLRRQIHNHTRSDRADEIAR